MGEVIAYPGIKGSHFPALKLNDPVLMVNVVVTFISPVVPAWHRAHGILTWLHVAQ